MTAFKVGVYYHVQMCSCVYIYDTNNNIYD